LLLWWDERDADVSLAEAPEVRARRDDDAVLQQARREGLGLVVRRYLDPEVHRGGSPAEGKALAGEELDERLAAAPVSVPGPPDVILVAPGDDRRALDEELGGRPHRRAE